MMEILYSSNFSSVFKAVLLTKIDPEAFLVNKDEEPQNTLFNEKQVDIDTFTSKKIYALYCHHFRPLPWLKSTNFIFFKKQIDLAFRHKNTAKYHLIENVIDESLEQGLAYITNKASTSSQNFYSFYKSVSTDIHANKGFCRLKPTKDNQHLIGEIRTEHHTGDIILNFFIQRFPEKRIALFDRDKGLTFAYDLDSVFMLKNRNFQHSFDKLAEEDLFADYWQAYYATQYIPERKNKKLALKNFPQKRWHDMFEVEFLRKELES